MARFKLLSFDLDDTLWSMKPLLLHAEQKLTQWLCTHYPAVHARWTPKMLLVLRQEVLEKQPELRHQISKLRMRVTEEAMRRSGMPSALAKKASQLAFEVFLEARHEVKLFDKVEESLFELSREFRLAAITNGNADIFRLALGNIFSFAVRAEELGTSKPDPILFLTVQRQAGVAAHEMIHVGDHAEQDVAAAKRLGITAVWANLYGNEWPAPDSPDAEITHFGDLPTVIERLGRPD